MLPHSVKDWDLQLSMNRIAANGVHPASDLLNGLVLGVVQTGGFRGELPDVHAEGCQIRGESYQAILSCKNGNSRVEIFEVGNFRRIGW
jgi:hypothetical protein